MSSWTPPPCADAGTPLVPPPQQTALAALPSIGRMPILQGILLFVGLFAAHVSANLVKALLAGPLGPALATTIGYVLASAIAVCFYFVAVRLVGARQASDFEGTGWVRELLSGVIFGALLMGVVVAVAWAFGAYTVTGFNPHSQAAPAAAIFLLAGVGEEIAFRAGLLRLIEHRLGTWWALAITSILFGAAHLSNPEASLWGATAITIEAGILLGACYVVTRRLWLVMGLHWAWNFVQGAVFSSDVSGTGTENEGLLAARIEGPQWLTGGNMGFEGSVVTVVVGLAVGIALLTVARRRGLVIPPGAFRRPKNEAPRASADEAPGTRPD
ncbi:CPBP family intramembrane glutamic endopeptidase [Schaalia meyeri]|nr:type II CAAX endopeptidase family protein [Schaalia meyeri]SDR84339.1 hypothetical protein SAMN04489715_1117 [Schaalia meyeri]